MVNIYTKTIAATAAIIAIAVFAVPFFADKVEVTECLKWAEEARTLPDYELAEWQKDQCKAHDIIIAAGPEEEYCLTDIFPDMESFKLEESGPGEYHYQIIATTRGIEIWRECTN